jgi:hypothetical protein
MGKLKNHLIEMQETQDKNYRPFQPSERLHDVEVLPATIKPVQGLLEGREWTPASQTDVTRTWRRFGWKPIAEIEAEKGIKK